MANDPKRLRKAYEFKIGKDRTDKLSNQQISLLSKYYNSLSESEQRSIDAKIFKGASNDLFDMADAFIQEKKQKATKTTTKPKARSKKSVIPKGFDELIDEIQGKTQPKVTPDDIIEEKIDKRIVEILGLDTSVPIDYGIYKSLLIEKLKSYQFSKVQPSTEVVELLTKEYKRIKKKTSDVIFKVKSRKISPKKLVTRWVEPSQKQRSRNKYIVSTRSLDKDITPNKESSLSDSKILDSLVSINESMSGILSFLKDRRKEQKSSRERDRKKSESEKRRKKEDRFENLKKVTTGIVSKVLSPVKSAFDAILNFLKWVFIGKLGGKVFDWFMDPKNTEKVATLGRFLSDWWPAILGAFVMFTNPLGGFIKNVVGMVTKFTFQILRVAIPKIISLARKNPKLASAMVLFGAGAAAGMIPGATDTQESIIESTPGSKQDKIKKLKEQKESMDWFQKNILGRGAEIDEQIYRLETGETKRYKTGGKVTGESGTDIRGAGVDTQLIAARPGEVVINKETVNALGAEYFLGLNKKYGGSNANKPKIARNVQTAAGGGLVLPAFANGGMVGEYNERPAGGTYMGQRESQIERYFNYFRRASNQVPKVISSSTDYTQRAISQIPQAVSPTLDYAQRVVEQIPNVLSPTINYTQRVIGQAPNAFMQGIVNPSISTAKSIRNNIPQMYSTLMGFADAGNEALPAILSGYLGIKRTDKRISPAMQKAILDAQKTAKSKNRNFIEYEDYDETAGGIAGKYTMGRVADSEFLRDSKGRIVGMKQAFDTNRPAKESMLQTEIALRKFLGIDNSKQVSQLNSMVKNRLRKMGVESDVISRAMVSSGGDKGKFADIKTAFYKPFEALLDHSQKQWGGKGATTHEVLFDEKVLGFKPVEAAPKPGSMDYESFIAGGGNAAIRKGKTVRDVVRTGRPLVESRNEKNKKDKEFLSKNPGVTLYGPNDPRRKSNKLQRSWYDPRSWFGKQGGGIIKENTGMNIMGATADRQLIAAQPGEYILPVDFVNSVGVSAIDKLVAYFDSNSNAAKMGNKSVNVKIPGPRLSSSSRVKTLPPIMQQSGSPVMGRGSDQGTNVPNFNIISPSSIPSRNERMSLYGIMG